VVRVVGIGIGPRFYGQRSKVMSGEGSCARPAQLLQGAPSSCTWATFEITPSFDSSPFFHALRCDHAGVMYRARIFARRGLAGDSPGQGRARHGGGTRHTGASQVKD